jgi:hypothetical protein
MRRKARGGALAGLAMSAIALLIAPAPVAAAIPLEGQLHADVEGKSIALSDVGKYFCEDFSAPAIHCFSRAADLEASVEVVAAAATNYVIVYEFQTYAGAYMYMSQDYSALVTIGWNDRISSYRALNSESGHFFTDWFYGGSGFGFCCNQQVPGLGVYDNTYSSVHRN